MKSQLNDLFSSVEKLLAQTEEALEQIKTLTPKEDEQDRLKQILVKQSAIEKQLAGEKVSLLTFLANLARLAGREGVHLDTRRTLPQFDYFFIVVSEVVPEIRSRLVGDIPRVGGLGWALREEHFKFPFGLLSSEIIKDIEGELRNKRWLVEQDVKLLGERRVQIGELLRQFQSLLVSREN